MNKMHQRAARPFLAFVLTLALVPVGASAQTKVKAGFNLFSVEQDFQIGMESSQQAEQQLPIVRDSFVNSYVTRIGQRLAANAGGPNFQYQFRVVNQADINAFALPGGFIYVNRGILEQARNDGEVAGVLAHEISHAALRHGTHQASKAYGAQAGLSILGGLLGGKIGSGTANIINAVGGFGMNVLFLKYSRDLESQADIRGAQILAASGYSPADMVGFFQTLERVDPSKKTNFLSDHPAPPDRIARIQREAQMLKVSSTPTRDVAELRSVQGRMNGMGSAPTAEQIARSGPAAGRGGGRARPGQPVQVQVPPPSSSMETYTNRSGVYQVSYPSNWRVYEGGGTGVTLAPEGGVATIDGKADVVYGAIINHYEPFNNTQQRLLGTGGSARNATMEDATNDLIAQVQQSSPYLREVSGSAKRIQMNRGTALSAVLRGSDPETGIDERVTIVTQQLADGHLLYMLFIIPQQEAATYNRALNAMVASLQVNATRRH